MNIAIIVLDSLRADKLGPGNSNICPFLNAFKREALYFKNAFTTAPWTLPSHASLFTGLYPSEHNLQSGLEGANLRLSNAIRTLPEVLKEIGYCTAGFSSNPWIGKSSSLNRGFDIFVEHDFEVTRGIAPNGLLRELSRFHKVIGHLMGGARLSIIKRPYISKMMMNAAMNWVNINHNKRWFMFINLMDGHNPYQPLKGFVRQVSGNLSELLPRKKFNRMLGEYIRGDRPPDNLLIHNAEVYYNASVAHADFQTKRFVTFLKRRGLFKNTLLFILSDHGKTLGEYDRKEFPFHYLTDINIHIPLICYNIKHNPAEISHTVSLIDIYYTILKQVGISANPNYDLRRITLEDRMETKDNKPVFLEVLLPYSGKRAKNQDTVHVATDGRYRLVSSQKKGETLIDKSKDPEEKKNFAAQDAQHFLNLKEELKKWRSSLITSRSNSNKFGVEDMDEEVRKHLKSLGYM